MMNMFASPTENAISLINHVTSMQSILTDMNRETAGLDVDITTKIDAISGAMKEVDPMMMCTIEEFKHFSKYLLSLNKSLQVKRFNLINEIDKRRNTEIQMNTNGELYNEDDLITDISFNLNGEELSGIHQVQMKQMTDVKDYSILALVTKFENEDELLENLYTLTEAVCKTTSEAIMRAKDCITTTKKKTEDSEFISKVCGNDYEDVKDDIHTFVDTANASINHVSFVKTLVIKLFQIYQELLHNYQIYDKAIASYTSFALECFFNDTSKYEIL